LHKKAAASGQQPLAIALGLAHLVEQGSPLTAGRGDDPEHHSLVIGNMFVSEEIQDTRPCEQEQRTSQAESQMERM